jgi:hypothetical protein
MKRKAEDDDLICEDGESVRVPLVLCDSVSAQFAFGRAEPIDADNHRPHYVSTTDAAVTDVLAKARDARNEYIRGLTGAWRRTAARDGAEPSDPTSTGEMPDPGSLLRRHLEPDDAARLREKAWRARNDALSNAWRNPPGRTDPGAALAIEHRRRAYTYETGR